MLKIDKELDKYILDNIDTEDQLLQELNRQTHLKILRPRMLSGHLQGKILRMLSLMVNPTNILEIGTYTGYSALCLAEGLTDNGELHTIDINDEIQEFTESFISRSKHSDKIKLHIGSAIDIVPNLDMEFDMVFIDGDKRQYPEYFDIVIDKVKKGGYILADNILWDGKVLEDYNDTDDYTKGVIDFNRMMKEDNRVETVIIPLRDGLSVTRKI